MTNTTTPQSSTLRGGYECFRLALHRSNDFDFWELLNGRKLSTRPKTEQELLNERIAAAATELAKTFEGLAASAAVVTQQITTAFNSIDISLHP